MYFADLNFRKMHPDDGWSTGADQKSSIDTTSADRINDIYPYAYFIGSRQFDGIVNIKTYKGTIPSLTRFRSA